MSLWTRIKNLIFRTPSQTSIRGGGNRWFSFQNKDLATNETIFSAVTMLSNAIASAPISVKKGYEKLKPNEHKIAKLFKLGPNPYMTTFEFIRCMEVNRNTQKGAFAIKEYGLHGEIVALHVLDSRYVTPIMEDETKELYYEISGCGEYCFIHSSHIIAVGHISNNGYKFINPLNVLRNTIDYDTEIKEFNLNQMQNGLKANLVIKLQTKLDKEMMDLYNEMLTSFKKNGVLYVDQGKDFQELKSLNYIDPKCFEAEQITVEKVERVYNMPGKLTGKTNNAEDLLYLKDTILPIVRLYEQAFTKSLIPMQEILEDIEIKISLNGFARADMNTRGNFYFKGIRSSWFNADDIRALEDLPPLPNGQGQVYYVSRDLVPIDKIGLLLGEGGDNSGESSGVETEGQEQSNQNSRKTRI